MQGLWQRTCCSTRDQHWCMAPAVQELTLLCSEPETLPQWRTGITISLSLSLSLSATSVAMVCWTLHYAKRLLETLFVHRFSHATMPLSNLFKVRTMLKLRLLSIVFRTELQLLLGVCSFCFLLPQPPSLHTSR
jgi:hypothetical protein